MKPFVVCILDGWGESSVTMGNSIALAKTPVWDTLTSTYPWATLEASGTAVGVPVGQMGNSEVGHLTLGLGRRHRQAGVRLDEGWADGTLVQSPCLLRAVKYLQATGKTCHIWGLLSQGGVHGDTAHMALWWQFWRQQGIPVQLHGVFDGRDGPAQEALISLKRLEMLGIAKTAAWGTLSGRFYAMDRDKRWDRTSAAYTMILRACSQNYARPQDYIEACYAKNLTDEFIPPVALIGYKGFQVGDGLLMCNFRADRLRQLVQIFMQPSPDFHVFQPLPVVPSFLLTTIPLWDKPMAGVEALLEPEILKSTLGEVLSLNGKTQCRLAETEKYAHITYFFNGKREEPFPGETRVLIPSPRHVATYDACPQMSAIELTEVVLAQLAHHDVCFVNFANADMVGHTGNLPATIEAIETLDACLGRLVEAIKVQGGTCIITSDHGNAECMYDAQGNPHTAHTCAPVPFMIISPYGSSLKIRQGGGLEDVAPTILSLLGLPQPSLMTGCSLV